jgi:hypothetical protein
MAYRIKSSFLEPCLFKDAVEGARCDIVAGLSGNSNTTGFGEVLKLSVTSLCRDQIPPVIVKHPQDFTHFHTANIPMCEDGAKQMPDCYFSGFNFAPCCAQYAPTLSVSASVIESSSREMQSPLNIARSSASIRQSGAPVRV